MYVPSMVVNLPPFVLYVTTQSFRIRGPPSVIRPRIQSKRLVVTVVGDVVLQVVTGDSVSGPGVDSDTVGYVVNGVVAVAFHMVRADSVAASEVQQDSAEVIILDLVPDDGVVIGLVVQADAWPGVVVAGVVRNLVVVRAIDDNTVEGAPSDPALRHGRSASSLIGVNAVIIGGGGVVL